VYSQFVGIIRSLQSVSISCSVYNVNVRFQLVIYYVSEHQLPPVIDASHTTSTTRVNQGPKLLKLVEETLSILRWVPYIPGTTAQSPGAEPEPIAR